MSNKRLIDGDKLLEWLEGNHTVDNYKALDTGGRAVYHLAMNTTLQIVESGIFDSPPNQGEAAILREAIKEAMNKEWELAGEPTPVYTILHHALSSITEDTEWQGVLVPESEIEVHRIEDVPDGQQLAENTGIQKVRKYPAYDFDHCPECTGSFSFRKPVDGKCPWCESVVSGITDGGEKR